MEKYLTTILWFLEVDCNLLNQIDCSEKALCCIMLLRIIVDLFQQVGTSLVPSSNCAQAAWLFHLLRFTVPMEVRFDQEMKYVEREVWSLFNWQQITGTRIILLDALHHRSCELYVLYAPGQGSSDYLFSLLQDCGLLLSSSQI